jgi:hypothetical protein
MAAALDSFYLKEQAFYHVTSGSMECSNFLTSYSPFSYYSACCRTMSQGSAGLTGSQQDVFETPAIAFSSLESKCEAATPSSVPHIEESRYLFPEAGLTRTTFTGLSCRTNKTVNIYLLDSNLFWLYAERLGAPSSTPVKEFATIVDVKEESHYILDPKQALMKLTLGTILQAFAFPTEQLALRDLIMLACRVMSVLQLILGLWTVNPKLALSIGHHFKRSHFCLLNGAETSSL